MRNMIDKLILGPTLSAMLWSHPGFAQPFPSPCRYTAGATLEMLNINNAKCRGTPGSMIEIEVVTSLKAPLAYVSFQPPLRSQANVPSFAKTPPLYVAAVFAPAVMGPNTAPGTPFNGLNRGSLYTVMIPLPPSLLCLGQHGVAMAWNVYGYTAAGAVPGPPIDLFLTTCK